MSTSLVQFILVFLVFVCYVLIVWFLGNTFPEYRYLFEISYIATFCFVADFILGMSSLIFIAIALVGGFFFADVWYVPVAQYILLKICLFIVITGHFLVLGLINRKINRQNDQFINDFRDLTNENIKNRENFRRELDDIFKGK